MIDWMIDSRLSNLSFKWTFSLSCFRASISSLALHFLWSDFWTAGGASFVCGFRLLTVVFLDRMQQITQTISHDWSLLKIKIGNLSLVKSSSIFQSIPFFSFCVFLAINWGGKVAAVGGAAAAPCKTLLYKKKFESFSWLFRPCCC